MTIRVLIISVFLSFIPISRIQGQTTYNGYVKLLDNTSWKYAWSLHNAFYKEYWWHTIGDTNINSKKYTVIQHTDTHSTFLSWFDKRQYLREDSATRKVYYLNDSLTRELLLYDFDLKVGDSILEPYYASLTPRYLHVDVIDTIQTQFGWRRRILVDTMFSWSPKLIEGVGWDLLGEADFRIFDKAMFTAYHHALSVCIYKNRIQEHVFIRCCISCESMCPSIGLSDKIYADTNVICQGDSVLLVAPCDSTFFWTSSAAQTPFNINFDSIYVKPDSNTTYYWHGNLNTDSISIIVNKKIDLVLGPDLILCDGDSIELHKGNPLYKKYLWSDHERDTSYTQLYFENTSNKYVWLEVTDSNGCSDRDSIALISNNIGQCLIEVKNQNGSTVQFNAKKISENVDNWYWDFGDGSTHVGDTSVTKNYLSSGTYKSCLVMENECGQDSSCVLVDISTGSEEYSQLKIDLFPNPVKTELIIDLREVGQQVTAISITNSLGQNLHNLYSVADEILSIDFTNYEKGIYFIHFLDKQGRYSTERIVKN